MIKRILPLILLCSCATAAPLPFRGPAKPALSPKAVEFQQSLGARMVAPPPDEDTNSVFSLSFSWQYSSPAQFRLHFGQQPGIYTDAVPVGTNKAFTLILTNWPEEYLRHFYAVKAIEGMNISPPSNEVHWPPFPPDHIAISWRSNWASTTILTSATLRLPRSQWTALATVSRTNQFVMPLQPGPLYFCLNRPDVLTIRAFNPSP